MNTTIAFAIDSKLNMDQLQKFRYKVPEMQLVSNIHITGSWARIIALWDPQEVSLQNWYVHPHWIVLHLSSIQSGLHFVVIRVYMHTDFRIRKELFLNLCTVVNHWSMPVICLDDFNVVSNSDEKTGRAPALQACITLSNFVSHSLLSEISCSDMKFTWTNNRLGQENVMSKIDMCYVSQEWLDDPVLTLQLEVLPRTISDHNSILLHISKRRYSTWGRTPFRHFQYWQDMAGYSDLVCSAWAADTRGCLMIKHIHKLEATRDKLKVWCRGEVNNLPNQIMATKSKIKCIQTHSECGMREAIEEENILKHDLCRLLWLEERLWRQKSRIKWLRDGDMNTKFFQGIANGRRHRNKIETISYEGRLATDSHDIFIARTEFFATLLGTTHGSSHLPQTLAPGPTVTPEENDELLKPIIDTEIKWAVMEANRDSTPGPDGFGNSFFQANWSVVHEAQSSPWAELVRGRYYERKGMTENSTRGKRVSKAWRRALQAWSRIKASTGGILIGKEPSIKKCLTGFALGFLGAMASCMKIDGSIPASLRGARTTKEEWQVSLETFLVGSGLAWLAGSGTTQGGARQRFF
ncbi:hypothetical protein EJ110_NYTH28086 [Nymphaea thermarum]|nr:hypothetical protein EJ110_NYTH28086 [Nymphaea thermarum]